jgi:hypothetical protein
MLFRYLTALLPACAVLLALAVDRALAWNRPAGAALLMLLAGTDVLHRIPLGLLGTPGTEVADRFGRLGPFSLPLAGVLHEITHELKDCSRALASHLRARARPSDVVLTTYGDSPLQFHTGLKVVGGFQGRELPTSPDWVVLRSTVLDPRPGRDHDVLRFVLRRIDLEGGYEPVDLGCSDHMLAACTEPRFHLFQSPAEVRRMRVYRRRVPTRG